MKNNHLLPFKPFALLVLLLCITSYSYSQKPDYRYEVESLLSEMTLDEKIGQMNQLNFEGLNDELLQKVKRGEVGSLLNVTDTEVINILQKAAIENGNGIPLVIARDVIHGYKTIFPIPLGQAASFDPEVARIGACVAAAEASEHGIRWTFAPMIDIARDARWGRIAESLGEDPFLSALMGAAMVRGFQGEDLSLPNNIAACAKHFVGYGAAEGGRDYNSTSITPLALRNTYLPPFQKAIDEGVATVMTSFNDNDGIPTSGNSYLLKDVLRQEMEFRGVVVSDWNSVGEMITHGFAADGKDAAMLSANAGLDMEMNTELYVTHLKQLVQEGKVSVADIDNSVRYILQMKFRLGLFSNPYVKIKKTSVVYTDAHLQAAKEAALKSAILLKNENNTLPLKETQKIAVFGPMADAPYDQLGTWIFDGEANHTVTPIGALKSDKAYENIKFTYETALSPSLKDADVAVVFLGEESKLSGEASSLSDINLRGTQSALLKEIKATGKPVVLVIMAGRPLTIERDLPYADAVLYNFHPGTMGGPAILDLLFGRANPSGKLPVTFVREVGQIPLYYNHNNTGRPAPDNARTLNADTKDVKQTSVGDVSHYLDSGKGPLFPFGFGLSYSRFEYSELSLSSPTISMNDSLIVSVTLRNTSNIDGVEIAQLYVRDLVGSIIRPVKELKGFQRVSLNAGETKIVTFTLFSDDLAFYGIDLIRKAEPGFFDVWIGGDSKTSPDKKRFELK
ncbi:glycoside hydrolase family 3 N-terminal domain-containing protein [Bacteroides sp. 51]|uniref:glycoside hydrolase family 3 N-terminal domain-containing protein n=1 Tax=Bacteroides sp. 51 TaxID=2302938 RepID=UPI0013D5198B|nr:glycoside hydrolase family 3 N-terminal domain-containing protein [Bacteroides sp. 51]NDV81764.1 glycosyl hydrolase [Bacteroides sp. 51]